VNERAPSVDLVSVAAATALVLAMVAAAGVLYQLLDVVMLFFLGIVVAAALQPWHLVLCRWGVPKGLAVLLIYLLLLVALLLVVVIVGPVLVEQLGRFFATLPDNYARGRSFLVDSGSAPLRLLGQGMPALANLAPASSGFWPQVYAGTVGVTASIVTLPAWFVTVLAIAFYWTMELPRFERLVVSLIDVERRPRALQVWHDIEFRLGGFLRGQGLAMLFIGTVSGVGYAWIGLPNVLALGVLAGVLEAIPWIGPLLAVVPAMIVALPLGTPTILMVMGLAVLLQSFENNVLIPRLMSHSAGVSALVSLLAILAFGTLYGLLGVFLAIPLAAVIQVLIDTLVVNVDPRAPTTEEEGSWDVLRARVEVLRQEARRRLRSRTSRMTLDPLANEAGVDAVDSDIETTIDRLEELIAVARAIDEPSAGSVRADIAEKLEGATGDMEDAKPGEDASDGLAEASDRFTKAVQDAGKLVPPDSR
jgi:predicted PurR-regulated permease PerM